MENSGSTGWTGCPSAERELRVTPWNGAFVVASPGTHSALAGYDVEDNVPGTLSIGDSARTAATWSSSLAYHGRSWGTVRLELSLAGGESGIDVDRVPAVDVSQFGLKGPETVPCLAVRCRH